MKSLAVKNQLLTSILDAVDDIIISTDSKGLITFINKSAQNVIGISIRAATGKNLKDVLVLKDLHSEKSIDIPDPKSFRENINPHKLTRSICTGQHGRTIIVDVIFTPIVGTKQKITGMVVTAQDATNTTEQERLLEDQWKIEAIVEITRTISQDFTDYLGLISGHASSISDNLIPNTRSHEEVLKIMEITDYAAALIKRLSNIARATVTNNETELQPVAINTVVAGAINMLEATFLQRNIVFKVQSPNSMPYALGDESMLRDCLISLFVNAADAISSNGTITVDCVEKSINNDTFSVIRVRDTGAGMTKEVLAKLFDPFFTTKSSTNAMGLGLTIIRSTIRKMNGFIKVRSFPERGASFRIFLKKAEGVNLQMKKSVVHGETIVLVDGRNADRIQARDILSTAGYNVYAAKNAKECVALFNTHGDSISASIIDVFMPGADVKTLLKNILAIDPAAAIIMTSGFSRDYVRGYLKHGAWRFSQKPWDPEHLLLTVRSVIDKKNIIPKKSSLQS